MISLKLHLFCAFRAGKILNDCLSYNRIMDLGGIATLLAILPCNQIKPSQYFFILKVAYVQL